MSVIITTLIHRPYVFAFLIAFLVLGRIYWGWRKTFLWLVIGYVVAWASEASSIRNGFPYGLYHYIYENMQGELMVLGVPFWDSLSYPFMIYAGYTTAQFLCGSLKSQILNPKLTTHKLVNSKTAFLGALLTMLLDIIIDPLTVMGDRWFLGRVYYYPNGGSYFGVPLTNFLGWFVVPLAVILIWGQASTIQFWSECKCGSLTPHMTPHRPTHLRTYALTHFLNPLFYISIALFNIIITIWIGEPLLASINCFLLIPVVGAVIWRFKKV